jgi:hypothetical protein
MYLVLPPSLNLVRRDFARKCNCLTGSDIISLFCIAIERHKYLLSSWWLLSLIWRSYVGHVGAGPELKRQCLALRNPFHSSKGNPHSPAKFQLLFRSVGIALSSSCIAFGCPPIITGCASGRHVSSSNGGSGRRKCERCSGLPQPACRFTVLI